MIFTIKLVIRLTCCVTPCTPSVSVPNLASSLHACRQQSSLVLHSVRVSFNLTHSSTCRELLLKPLHDYYSVIYEMDTGIIIMLTSYLIKRNAFTLHVSIPRDCRNSGNIIMQTGKKRGSILCIFCTCQSQDGKECTHLRPATLSASGPPLEPRNSTTILCNFPLFLPSQSPIDP